MSESGVYHAAFFLSEIMVTPTLLCNRNLVLSDYGNIVAGKEERKQGVFNRS
jgi:hypothetical protein